MLSSRNKTKTSAVAFIALLTLSAVVAILPAFAQKTYTKMPDRDTGTVTGASPKLIGLGQKTLINVMTYPAPSGPTYFAQDLVSKLAGFEGISVTITKPDGTKDTFKPIDDSLANINVKIPGLQTIVGSLQFFYEPDQVGTYSVTASFPGQTYNTDGQYANLNLSVYYKPSSTKVAATFTVQDDLVLAGQLNGWPWSPLPTAFWKNPVSTDNREWAAISGDWIQGVGSLAQQISKYNDYSTAPNSPHIIWANEVGQGGIPGGIWGSLPYGGGGGAGNIVLDGKIYQSSALQSGYFDCIDLRTGQKLWSASGSVNHAWRIDPFYQTEVQQAEGSIAVNLWGYSGTTWVRYNPFNGAVMQTLTNAPTDVWTRAWEDGNPIVWVTQGGGYNTTRPLGYRYLNLIKWNYTKCTYQGLFQTGSNWPDGIVWNVSVILPNNEVSPGDNAQGWSTQSTTGQGFKAYPFPGANVVIAKSHNDMQVMLGYDMTTGALLWKNNQTVLDIGVRDPDGGPNGPLYLHDGATQTIVAYNVKTGQEIFRTPQGELPWGMIPNYNYVINVRERVFYYGSYDGHVYAVNADTGERIWQSDYYGDEDESIYGTQPFSGGSVGADGKVYFSSTTTYSLMPRTRFHALVAIDEATGHYLWKLPIGIAPSAVADGYLIGTDSHQGIQYGIGKGKTSTTVVASPKVAASGSGVLIEGSVMDLSPGAPNTAAVSDADMSEWMDYLYGQNATLLNSPPTPHGVSVQLTALGSDGSAIDLGTVTSDESGQYAKAWTPSSEGLYKIYATFAGSESYWSSWAETSVSVGPAQETDNTQPPAAAPDNTMLLYGILVAVVVAILIGLAALLSVFRKH